MTRSLKIAIAMAALASIWVLSGSLASNNAEVSQTGENNNDDLFAVRIAESQAVPIARQIKLQGELNARRTVTIRAETSGTITELNLDKGKRALKGALLAGIAANDRPAKLEKAKATLALRKADLAAGLKLKERKLLSDLQYQQYQAAVVAAEADVKAIEIELAHTRIKAPFDSLLSSLHVEIGDRVSEGDPIATLVDDSAAKIEAQLPQQHIGDVALGQKVRASLIDGSEIDGTVTYLSNHASPQTRTFAMEARADNTQELRHFGQSARVTIDLGESMAHLVSASALDLDADGELQIKALNADQRVTTFPVTLLRNDTEGVWLGGLPKDLDIIVVGQGFVRQGEHVRIAETEARAEAGAAAGVSP